MAWYEGMIREMAKRLEEIQENRQTVETLEMKQSCNKHQQEMCAVTQYVLEKIHELDEASEKACVDHIYSTCGDYVRGAYYPGLLSPIMIGNTIVGKIIPNQPTDGAPYYLIDISSEGKPLRSCEYRNGRLISKEYMVERGGLVYGVTVTKDASPYITTCECWDGDRIQSFYEVKYSGSVMSIPLSYLEEDYFYNEDGLTRSIRRTIELGILIRAQEVAILRTDGKCTGYTVQSYPRRENEEPETFLF